MAAAVTICENIHQTPETVIMEGSLSLLNADDMDDDYVIITHEDITEITCPTTGSAASPNERADTGHQSSPDYKSMSEQRKMSAAHLDNTDVRLESGGDAGGCVIERVFSKIGVALRPRVIGRIGSVPVSWQISVQDKCDDVNV